MHTTTAITTPFKPYRPAPRLSAADRFEIAVAPFRTPFAFSSDIPEPARIDVYAAALEAHPDSIGESVHIAIDSNPEALADLVQAYRWQDTKALGEWLLKQMNPALADVTDRALAER